MRFGLRNPRAGLFASCLRWRSCAFSPLLAGPSAAIAFVKKLLARTPAPLQTHNPLGGWMVLGAAASTAGSRPAPACSPTTTSWRRAARRSGQQARRISYRRSLWNFNLLLLLASVHVLAVLYHFQIMKKISSAHVHRREAFARRSRGMAGGFAMSWRALVLLAVAAPAVYSDRKTTFLRRNG